MSQIAFFQHLGAKKGENVPLSKMLDEIKGSQWSGQVKRLRAMGREAENYDETKKNLPAYMLSGTTRGGHKASDVIEHSGLLQIDVDKVGADKVGDLRDRIGDDRHIQAAWISPSGDGVKAIMRIPASIEGHKAAFVAAFEYMQQKYCVEIDPSCSDVGRLCFVSHDPDLVVNPDAISLEVSTAFDEAVSSLNSSILLNTASYVLHNKVFTEFPRLERLYRQRVAKRYGEPERGHRNQVLKEIVCSLFSVMAPNFVIGFAEEYYTQHSKIFADYDYDKYQREAHNLISGLLASYPARLNPREREAFAKLHDEDEQTAFRIAESLSKYEDEAEFPPPLFHLSCRELGLRLGVMDTPAQRILRGFEASGIIEMVKLGTIRTAGVRGVATTWSWMLNGA